MDPTPAGPPALLLDWLLAHVFTPLDVHHARFWVLLLGTVVVYFGLLALLQQLGSAQRRWLTRACTFLAGLFFLLTYSLPQKANVVKGYEQPVGDILMIISAFTIGLGIINLVAIHGRTLVKAQSGWHNSLAFFVGFLGMAVFGVWQIGLKTPPDATAIPLATAGYRVFFDGLLQPLQSTTFALLGFFIVSAAYRAFRIRSLEAGLMTVVAFVVMLGQVPLGQLLTAWIPMGSPLAPLRIEQVTNWLMTVPNSAATRGILFGSAVGGFALSLRVWLSLERGSYFGKEF